MDFTEVARSLPQFGKSMRNLRRSRREVFSPSMHESKRRKAEGCFCGPMMKCSSQRSCGCSDSALGASGVLSDDTFGEPWGDGVDVPWIGNDNPSGDGARSLLLVQGGMCCVAVYCHLIDTKPKDGEAAPFYHKKAMHCYFQVLDCSGSIFRLELDPLKVTEAIKAGKTGEPISMISVIQNHTPEGKDVREFYDCQPCSEEGGGSSCQLVSCLLRETMTYPFAEVQPEELPKPGDGKNMNTMVMPWPISSDMTSYKVDGPNSNTFVAYVARRCGMPPLRQIRPGRFQAYGASKASDQAMKDYWERHVQWMEGR